MHTFSVLKSLLLKLVILENHKSFIQCITNNNITLQLRFAIVSGTRTQQAYDSVHGTPVDVSTYIVTARVASRRVDTEG